MDEVNDCHTVQFNTLLGDFNLDQHETETTHKEGHMIDVIITRSEECVIIGDTAVDSLISDHFSIICNLAISKPKRAKQEIVYRKYRAIPLDSFQEDIARSDLCTDFSNKHLEELCYQYDAVLRELVDKYAPQKKKILTQRNEEPWFNDKVGDERKLLGLFQYSA